jgi:hypothetical protein
MRHDYRKQIRDCAAIPCSAAIQIHHARWYRGKYNGKVFNRLIDVLIERHVPMPRLMIGTWGGAGGIVLTGVVVAGSGRIDRQVYRLDRGRYWVRSTKADSE